MFTNLHLRAVQATDARRATSFSEYLALAHRHDLLRPGSDRRDRLVRKLSAADHNGDPRGGVRQGA